MNLTEILMQLRRERALIEEAIAVLERLLAESGTPRRGRPPKWLKARVGTPTSPPKTKVAGG